MTDSIQDLTFEAAFTQLETIVHRLENEQLALNDALDLFEQGQKLTAYCQQLLEAAELRISQINDSGVIRPLTDS